MIRKRLRGMVGIAVLNTLLMLAGGPFASLVASSEERGIVKPLEDIQAFAFSSGEELEFEVGWNGIRAGNLRVSARLEEKDGRPVFRYVGTGETSSLVRFFYHTEDRVESLIDARSLTPLSYDITRKEKGKLRETSMVLDNGVFKSRRVTPNSDTRHEVDAAGSYDPFSILYLARSLPLEVGASYTFGLFDGRTRFRLTFHVEGREVIRGKAGAFDALRIRPELENLDEPDESDGRVRKVRFWLTNDRFRVPIRMESDVTFGKVYAELTGFKRGEALQVHRD